MIKRIVCFLSVLSLLAITACKSKDTDNLFPKDLSLISAVPTNATIIIETSSIERLKEKLSSSELWKASKGVNWHEKISGFFNQVSTLIPEKYQDDRFIITATLSGAHSFNYLLLKHANKQQEQEYTQRLKPYNESAINYNNVRIYSAIKGKKRFYYAFHRNVFLTSPEKLLIEEGVRQLSAKVSILSNNRFKRLYRSTDQDNTLNVFVQNSNLNDLVKDYFVNTDTEWTQFLFDLSALEFDFSSNKLKIEGVTSANFNKARFFSVFNNLKSHKKNILDELPVSTKALFYLSLDNYKKFSQNYNRYLNASQILYKRERNLKKYKKFDLINAFDKWVGDQAVIAYLSVHKANAFNALFMVKTTNVSEAKDFLGSTATKKTSYRGYKIYQSNYKNILSDAFGNYIDKTFFHPYFLFKENIVVFANSPGALKIYINDILLQKYFTKNESNHDFISLFNEDAHVFAMANGVEAIRLIYPLIDNKQVNNFKKHEASLTKITHGGIQINFDNDTGFTQGFITTEKPGEKHRDNALQLWNQSFKGKIKKVSRVTNYKTKRQDFLVEDNTRTIYWISHSGEQRWKRSLGESILGHVHQMDIFRNGRLQLVFNTATKLYVLDQNGKDVHPFPIRLHHSATAGAGLFDYDKRRDYRILVPQGDRMTMYSQSGQVVKGFGYTLRKSINREPKHIRVKQKDYIVTTTTDGSILILSRLGKIRVKVPEKFKEINDFKLLAGKITFRTQDNQRVKIDFNGNVTRYNNDPKDKRTKLFSSGTLHLLKNEVIFKGKSIISYDLDEANDYWVNYFEDAKNGFLIIVDNTLKQIIMLDDRGKIVDGFPVFGEQMVQLYKENNAYYMITQSNIDNSLICYVIQ